MGINFPVCCSKSPPPPQLQTIPILIVLLDLVPPFTIVLHILSLQAAVIIRKSLREE